MNPQTLLAARNVAAAFKSGDVKNMETSLAALQEFTECAALLGAFHLAQGNFETARKHLEAAPQTATNLACLASCCFRLRDHPAAIAAATAALKIDPANKLALDSLTSAKLLMPTTETRQIKSSNADSEASYHRVLRSGDLSKGFKLMQTVWYDTKTNMPGAKSIQMLGRSIPRWNGSHVSHLVVNVSYGMGDAIQLVRWCYEAQKRVDKLTVVTHRELLELFRRSGLHAVESIQLEKALQTADAQTSAPLLQVAMNAGYSPASGYLKAQGTLPASDRLRIGICWSASRDDRSAPLETLEPLRNLKGVEFFNLTYHAQAPDWMTPLNVQDLAQTADLIASMDLVISVDCVTAHLAGAIGRPVWIALQEPSEWRWQSGNTSPWYSTARLFRGDWADIFTRMTEEISNGLL